MNDKDSKVFVSPIERGELLTELNKFRSLEKFKFQLQLVSKLISEFEENMKSWQKPRNSREDLTQLHEIKTLQIYKKQKERLEQKIKIIEEELQKNIQNSSK